jgi:hypothetical protein
MLTSHTQRLFLFACAVVLGLAVAPLGADVSLSQADGRPMFKEGKALGYFVWREGDTWKVRWTTFGAEHRFTGRVAVEGGDIESLKRVDVDTERRVVRPGRAPQRGPRGRVVRRGRAPVVASREEDHIEQENERLIRFSTRTDDDIDGFDFKVTARTERLRLILEIDGQPKPEEVEVGRDNVRPNQHPLVVVLR